jgi:drug/metabolite transporter (DMT)-like permease
MDRDQGWNADAIRGALWMAAASMMIAMAAITIRHLSENFSAFQLVFFRSLIGTALLTPWLIQMGRRGTLRTRRLPMYALRTALSYSGMVCAFYGLAHMPIGDVYALLFLVPLITIALAVLILKEQAGAHTWFACAAGFAGAIIILRPGIVEFSLAAGAVLYTAVTYGTVNICIKSLTRTDTPVHITIYGNLIALPVSLIPALFVWVRPTWEDVPWIVAMGLCHLLAGLFHARSVNAADARVIQPFNFLRLPASVLLAYLFFAELPSNWTWVGAALIFASSYYVLYRESEIRRHELAKPDRPTPPPGHP